MTAGHTADPFSPEALDSLWRSGALITDIPGHNAWDKEATRAKLVADRAPAEAKPVASTAQTVEALKAEREKAAKFLKRIDEVIAANGAAEVAPDEDADQWGVTEEEDE